MNDRVNDDADVERGHEERATESEVTCRAIT